MSVLSEAAQRKIDREIARPPTDQKQSGPTAAEAIMRDIIFAEGGR